MSHLRLNLIIILMKTDILTHTQFANKLARLKGSSFVYLETDGLFKDMNKKGNPYFNEVRKHTKQTILSGFNYGNAVNNRLAKLGKEANFEPKERVWGRKVGTALIEHKGSFYIEGQGINCIESRYVEAEDNTTPISKEELKPFFNARKKKEEEESNKLLSEADMDDTEAVLDWACQNVMYRNYSFDNIKRVHMEGKVYTLVADSQAAIEVTIEQLEEEFELTE